MQALAELLDPEVTERKQNGSSAWTIKQKFSPAFKVFRTWRFGKTKENGSSTLSNKTVSQIFPALKCLELEDSDNKNWGT